MIFQKTLSTKNTKGTKVVYDAKKLFVHFVSFVDSLILN
jgi:hypothetical protein